MGTNTFIAVLPEMAAFTRVAELGSFSAAAASLGLTPSAVSRQVSRLEKEIGVQLIQRTTRQLRLTDAGVETFAHCRALVAAARAAMDVAQQHVQAPHGLVRLSAPKAFARHVLHPHLLTFLQRYPDVDVHLIVEDRDIDPIAEGVDLVVRLTDDPPPGLAARALMRVEQWLCASPAYLARHAAIEHPQDLLAHDCLYLGEHEQDNQWRLTRGDERATVIVRGRYVANHTEVRLGGVLADLGVGSLPSFIARPALEAGTVVRVLPEWELQASYRGQATVLYPPSRFTVPKCRVLIDHLVAALGDS